jgi:hypothetical protein
MLPEEVSGNHDIECLDPWQGDSSKATTQAEISLMLPLSRDETDWGTSFAGNIPQSSDAHSSNGDPRPYQKLVHQVAGLQEYETARRHSTR